MKTVFKNDEVTDINLCDSGIRAIRWLGVNYENLELTIDWCGQEDLNNVFDFDNISTKMVFNNVSDFSLNGYYPDENTIGLLDIDYFEFTLNSSGKYYIYFDLIISSNSYLKFNCNNFYFEISNLITQQHEKNN